MLDINKIESDINHNNLTKIEIAAIIDVPYTTTVHRLKTGNWLPNDIEKLADYFGRTIAYYFDREEKEEKPYKEVEMKHEVVEDHYERKCAICAEKEKRILDKEETIDAQKKHIEYLEFALGKLRKEG